MDDLIQQGVDAFKSGDKESARKLLSQAIKQNPDSERAWGWMCNAAKNDKERIACLQQILRINPSNEKARHSLETLSSFDIPSVNVSISPPIPEPTLSNQPKPNKPPVIKTLSILVIAGIVFLILALLFGSADKKVKYVVTGNTGTTSIFYTNETGGNDSIDFYLPFEKGFTVKSGGRVSIMATPFFGFTGSILTCEIWVNERLVASATANNTPVTCSAYAR